MRSIARGIFSRYNNLIFAVLEVWWRAYYNSALNFEEVFCINICCFVIRNNDSRVQYCRNHICQIHLNFVLHLDLVSRKQVTWTPEIIGHVTIRSATPDLLLVAFGFFSDISIGDQDTPHSCAAPWPSLQKVGHVTTPDHWSRDRLIGDPSFATVAFGIFQISLSATEICHILMLILDLVSRKQVTWPSKIIGHMTIWSASPDFLWVGFGISQIFYQSPSYCFKSGHAHILHGNFLKNRNVTLWCTIDKNRCDIWVFQIYEPIGSCSQNFDISTFKGVYP
jgi:hypothetical protein